MKDISEIKSVRGKIDILMSALIVQGVIFLLRGSIPDAVAAIAAANNSFGITANEGRLIIKIIADTLLYAASFGIPTVMSLHLYGRETGLRTFVSKATGENPIFSKLTVVGIISAAGITFAAGYISNQLFYLLGKVGVHIYQAVPEIPETAAGLILYFLAVTVIPAAIEEILFRGIALSVFLPFGKIFSIAMSSLLFALMHMDPGKFLYAFAGGAVFSYYTLKSGSLISAVIMHFSVNLLSFALLIIEKYCSENTAYTINMICFASALIVSLVSVAVFIKNAKKAKQKRNETLSESTHISIRERIVQAFTLPTAVYLIFTVYVALGRIYFD